MDDWYFQQHPSRLSLLREEKKQRDKLAQKATYHGGLVKAGVAAEYGHSSRHALILSTGVTSHIDMHHSHRWVSWFQTAAKKSPTM